MDSASSGLESLHNNRAIIVEQEGSVHCPVNSFKHYMANLNENCDAFFQHPDENKTGYDKKPIGKNTLGEMMKVISDNKHAKLSKIYTNHCIRKTTATVMHRQGYDLKEIANVMKHKNLQSLEHYIAAPTHSEKENYSDSLFQYTHDKKKRKEQAECSENLKKPQLSSPKEPLQSVTSNAIVPVDDNIQNKNDNDVVPLSQQVIQNSLKQAANMFQNATFNNCTINFQITK